MSKDVEVFCIACEERNFAGQKDYVVVRRGFFYCSPTGTCPVSNVTESVDSYSLK